jgi:serine/threonine protein kinase
LGVRPFDSDTSMSGFAGGKHPRVEEVYELGEQLGKGSFSTVYVGIDRKTREKVREVRSLQSPNW